LRNKCNNHLHGRRSDHVSLARLFKANGIKFRYQKSAAAFGVRRALRRFPIPWSIMELESGVKPPHSKASRVPTLNLNAIGFEKPG
jgi:hypothetical protein